MGSSAGDMISTADDLNKFFLIYSWGKLLKEQQLKQMLTTVPTGVDELGNSGLGIFKMKLQTVNRYGGMEEPFLAFNFCWRHT